MSSEKNWEVQTVLQCAGFVSVLEETRKGFHSLRMRGTNNCGKVDFAAFLNQRRVSGLYSPPLLPAVLLLRAHRSAVVRVEYFCSGMTEQVQGFKYHNISENYQLDKVPNVSDQKRHFFFLTINSVLNLSINIKGTVQTNILKQRSLRTFYTKFNASVAIDISRKTSFCYSGTWIWP